VAKERRLALAISGEDRKPGKPDMLMQAVLIN